MNDSTKPRDSYGSAEDLPSVIEMRQMLFGMKILGWVAGKKHRAQVRELNVTLDDISRTVDRFYEILGERGWIFHDDLNLPAIKNVVSTPDSEIAEQQLIAYYAGDDRLQWSLRRLGRHAAMRPRLVLAENALHDYHEGRYDSCVLILLSVVDGFVNDFEPARRKGLHARESDEMTPWDKAAGHHMGLANVHRTYNQRVSKLDSSEQFELRRNGLVHGMLPNFNNSIIATKAWNLLFAVSDWADGEIARLNPKDKAPTLRESLRNYANFQVLKTKSDNFVPYDLSATDPRVSELREHLAVSEFLESWASRRWGPVGGLLIRFGDERRNVGAQAQVAKMLYKDYPLDKWAITRVRRKASSRAHVEAELTIDGVTRQGAVQLILCDDNNEIELDPDAGNWFISPTYPESFWATSDTEQE